MKRTPLLASALACAALTLSSTYAWAGGFELSENTADSVSRGGTGVVWKHDPSAVYFNPARLTATRGLMLKLDSNFSAQQVRFQRDPLTVNGNTTTFDPSENNGGVFPAPFMALSYGFGDLAVGLGVFGPPAHTGHCFGDKSDGTCKLDPRASTRHMLVEANLLQIYALGAVAYALDLKDWGKLSLGVSGGVAYQSNALSLVIDAKFPTAPPWTEDPDQEGLLEITDLSGIRPTFILGASHEFFLDGCNDPSGSTKNCALSLAASWRPGISWETEGRAKITLPDNPIYEGSKLTDDRMTLRLEQAGSLRMGVGFRQGAHPAQQTEKGARYQNRSALEIEANVVWEDWSRTKTFEVENAGALENALVTIELAPIFQQKNWNDVWSVRLGASYAPFSFLTARAGAMFQSATQPNEFTSADFVAWEQYAGSLGATFHILPANLDLDIGGMWIASPDRTVTNGRIYNPIPLSQCQGPDFQDDACQTKGRPPGNRVNEGTWSTSAQVLSIGLTWWIL